MAIQPRKEAPKKKQTRPRGGKSTRINELRKELQKKLLLTTSTEAECIKKQIFDLRKWEEINIKRKKKSRKIKKKKKMLKTRNNKK